MKLLIPLVLCYVASATPTDDGGDDSPATATEYYGIYLAYFFGMVVLSLLLDRFGLMDETVARLGNMANKQFMKYEVEKARGNAKKAAKEAAKEAKKGGGCCGGSAKVEPDPESDLKKPHELPVAVADEGPSEPKAKPSCCRRFFCDWDGGEDEYNPLFLKKLLGTEAYYGCTDDMVCCLCCTSGMYADFIYFLLNHHSFLAMFCASKQNSFARGERRVAYFVQHSLAFMFAVILANSSMPEEEKIVVNCVLITPFTMAVNISYYYMLACPCLVREWHWACCKAMADGLECIGKVIAYPLSLLCFLLLFLAAQVTTDFGAVAKYAYQVHVTSMLAEVVLASCLFRYNTYTEIRFCGTKVFAFGTWFKEMCAIFDLEKGVHYHTKDGWLFCCCLTYTTWRRVPGVVRPLPFDGDVEMAQTQMGVELPTTAIGQEHTTIAVRARVKTLPGGEAAPEQQELIPGSAWVEAVSANDDKVTAMMNKIYNIQPEAAPQPTADPEPTAPGSSDLEVTSFDAKTASGAAPSAASVVTDAVIPAVNAASEAVKPALDAAADAMKPVLSAAADAVLPTLTAAAENAVPAASAALNSVMNAVAPQEQKEGEEVKE